MMKRFSSVLTLSVCALFAGCASTRLVETWKNPEFQGTLSFKKVVVIAITKEETTRRIAEDELVGIIGADKAMASHTLISMEDLKVTEKSKAAVEKAAADGLVMIRLLDVQKEVNYVPGAIGTSYYSPWGYSSYAWNQTYQAGYLATDTIIRVETNIYSVKDEKLIWSGVSETFNPGDLKTEVKGLAKVIQEKLKKEKLLP